MKLTNKIKRFPDYLLSGDTRQLYLFMKILIVFMASALVCLGRDSTLQNPFREIDVKIYDVSPIWRWSVALGKRTSADVNKPEPSNPMPGWLCLPHFSHYSYSRGNILQVLPDGLLISKYDDGSGLLFLINYPNTNLVDGQTVDFIAKEIGVYKYENSLGAVQTVKRYDYGKVWTQPPPKPLTAEQIAEFKRSEAAKKSLADEKALQWNRTQAEKGDAFGQYRMGIRFLKGEGVATDPQKAREWFTKSAAQGNTDAQKELLKLASK